ncbi:PDF receptor-like [Diadema antillarum]|uniref:PDF receptor-like n=1 Tax=Diadema antillarum TaxID=105358 RepID=UPI003A8A3533
MATGNEECADDEQSIYSSLFCPSDWDGEICWPAIEANQEVTLDCPSKPWLDPSKKLYRTCGENGTWKGRAHYENCILDSFPTNPTGKFNDSTNAQLEYFSRLTMSSRITSIVGCTLSWFSLVVALGIFLHFRSLNCNRTKIHKHFFVSLLIRLTIEIVFAIDHHYSIDSDHMYKENTIRFTPILCEVFEVFREYGRFCAFSWMFIEGLYLNSLVSIAVFGKPKFLIYYLIGWAFPVPFVTAWAIAMMKTNRNRCWYSHMKSPYYWGLIEVPRNTLIAINAIFLINIVRVLVTKLRESNSGETQQVRKAVKAAIVLLPLLGIVNLFWLLPLPRPNDSRATLVIYFVVFRFFDEFQGFFVAVLYCFLNQEVRMVLRRKWSTWRNYRDPALRGYDRRTSVLTSTSDINSTRSTKQRIGSGGFEYITVTV